MVYLVWIRTDRGGELQGLFGFASMQELQQFASNKFGLIADGRFSTVGDEVINSVGNYRLVSTVMTNDSLVDLSRSG